MTHIHEVTGAFDVHRFFSSKEKASEWIEKVVRALGGVAGTHEFIVKTHEVDGS